MPGISQYGWGAYVFAGLAAVCVVVLVACAALVSWRTFSPLGRVPLPVVANDTSRLELSEKIRQLDRTAFLVTSAMAQDAYRRRLVEAYEHVPKGCAPFDTDDKLRAETKVINKFISDLQSDLVGSHWISELERNYRRAESDADQILLEREVPSGLNVVQYRLFMVACMRRDYIENWLSSAILDAKSHEAQMLQMISERPSLHR